MTKKVYYIENANCLEDALEFLINSIPCFVERRFIEMDYSVVTVLCRVEDLINVERILAPLV